MPFHNREENMKDIHVKSITEAIAAMAVQACC